MPRGLFLFGSLEARLRGLSRDFGARGIGGAILRPSAACVARCLLGDAGRSMESRRCGVRSTSCSYPLFLPDVMSLMDASTVDRHVSVLVDNERGHRKR